MKLKLFIFALVGCVAIISVTMLGGVSPLTVSADPSGIGLSSTVFNVPATNWSSQSSEPFIGVSTTAGTWYEIGTPGQLVGLVDNINNSLEASWLTANIRLTANIDLGAHSWTPIGTDARIFAGTFDGRGFAINNMVGSSQDFGFFRSLTGGATVRNLTFNNARAVATGGTTGTVGILASAVSNPITMTINNVSVFNSAILSEDNDINNVGGLIGSVQLAATAQRSLSIFESSINVGFYIQGPAGSELVMGGIIGRTTMIADTVEGRELGINIRNTYFRGGAEIQNAATVARLGGTIGLIEEDVELVYDSGESEWTEGNRRHYIGPVIINNVRTSLVDANGHAFSNVIGHHVPSPRLNIVMTRAVQGGPFFVINFSAGAGTIPVGEIRQFVNAQGIPTQPTVIKDGYNFSHWLDGENQFDMGAQLTRDVNLLAVFEPQSPNLTWLWTMLGMLALVSLGVVYMMFRRRATTQDGEEVIEDVETGELSESDKVEVTEVKEINEVADTAPEVEIIKEKPAAKKPRKKAE